MSVDVVAIGGCTVDIVRAVDGTTAGRQLGGSAVYAAAGARVWGLHPGVVAFRGTGLPGGWAGMLADLDIDTDGLVPVNVPASITEFVYDADGERTQRPWRPDGEGEMTPHLPAETGEPIRRLLLSPEHVPPSYRGALGAHLAPMHFAAQRAIAIACGRVGILTLDPYPHVMTESTDEELATLLAPVTAFLPSLQEALARFPGITAVDALARLVALGVSAIVLKVGRRGSQVWDGRAGRRFAVPAVPVAVKDPTGAGDSFCGGVLAGLVEGRDLLQAAAYGAVSASFAVEDFCLNGVRRAERSERDRRLGWVLGRVQ